MTGTPSSPSLPPEASWYDVFYRNLEGTSADLRQPPPPWYVALVPLVLQLVSPESVLIELGCGHAHLLRLLDRLGKVRQENLWGVDQSQAAIDFLRRSLPRAHGSIQDLNRLELPAAGFDVVVMMETIEHLEDPRPALEGIRRILKPGGSLFLSFPNYVHLPWLAVRILAEKLNHPNWIVLQPIDQIYFFPGIVRRLRAAGLEYVRSVGSVYAPPLVYRWEPRWLTRFLDRCRLAAFSFHPVLQFRRAP